MISAVPKCLREQNFQQLIFQLLNEKAVDLVEFLQNISKSNRLDVK